MRIIPLKIFKSTYRRTLFLLLLDGTKKVLCDHEPFFTNIHYEDLYSKNTIYQTISFEVPYKSSYGGILLKAKEKTLPSQFCMIKMLLVTKFHNFQSTISSIKCGEMFA